MREVYLPQKITELFHMEPSSQIMAMTTDAKIARIMNYMHSEMETSLNELERKLTRKLELILREQI